MRRAIRIGRWIFTTVKQAAGAPLVDRCHVRDEDGRSFAGMAIQLSPWRREGYGSRAPQLAFVVAVGVPEPSPDEQLRREVALLDEDMVFMAVSGYDTLDEAET